MRTLLVVIAVLWCVTQAMAADPCASLQGHSLAINSNGFHGIIGPSGITLSNQNGTFTFQTTVQYPNLSADPVQGTCKDRHLLFTRTHQGPNGFVQQFDGWFFDVQPSVLAGVFSHNGPVRWGWFAQVKPVAPQPPGTQDPLCVEACSNEEQDCLENGPSKPACVQAYEGCIDECPLVP